MSKKTNWPAYAKTVPQLFLERVKKWPDHVVLRHKKDGQWVGVTFSEFNQHVMNIASGLIAEGLEQRDTVAIISGNMPEWAYIDFGSQVANIINVPIYPTNTAEQVAFIINDSGAQLVFAENKLQLEKILSVKDQMPKLEKVILIEAYDGDDDYVSDLPTLIATGKEKMDQDAIKARTDAIDPEDIVTMIYTSGTTGNPKGVMLCHRNIVSNIEVVQDFLPLNPGDSDLQFLPMCHSFGRMEVYVFMMHHGTINFAESIDKISQNFQEVKPLFFVTVPRLLEKVYEKIQTGLKTASPIKKKLFAWSLNVGGVVLDDKMAKRSSSFFTKAKFAVADKLVFSKIKGALGGNIKVLVYAAAPLALDIQRFFASTGIIAMEAYGLTETAPGVSGNMQGNFKLGSVGIPIRDTEVKIAEDGEILVRGPQIMLGYWNLPEKTEEALEGGWFHTGDIGRIDEDGFIFITDRKKDLIITAGGKNIAPQNIENLLKLDLAIEQAAVIGDKKKYLSALIVPSSEWLSNFAKEKGIAGSNEEILKDPVVIAEFEARIIKANKKLAKYETIKKFQLLSEEFSIENNMLTPTMKVRRKNVLEVYGELIDKMY